MLALGKRTNAHSLTDCGDRSDDFAELELVQDGGLAGSVKSDHEDAHLLLAEEALEQTGEHVSHGGVKV